MAGLKKVWTALNRHFYRICAVAVIGLQAAILYSLQGLATSRDVWRAAHAEANCGSLQNPCYIAARGRLSVDIDEVKVQNLRELCSSNYGTCTIRVEGKTEIEAPFGGLPVKVVPR